MSLRKSPSAATRRIRKPASTSSVPPALPVTDTSNSLRIAASPVFAEPGYMQDPTQYRTPHASDSNAYKELDELTKLHQFNPLPFRTVAEVTEPVMKLADAFGAGGAKIEQTIQKAGQIVFHSAGDTGATTDRR